MFPALLATLLFSISAVTATRTARVMGGTEANFWRLTLAAGLLSVYGFFIGPGFSPAAFPVLFLSGMIGFGLGDVTLFQALPRLGSRLTILLVHCLAAPLAAVCEWLWLGTRLTGQEMLYALVILSGVVVALAPAEHRHIPRHLFWPGVIFAALAAFGQGFGAVLSRQAFMLAECAGENLDGISAAWQRIIAGVMFGGLCLLIVKRAHLVPGNSGGAGQGSNWKVHLTNKWRNTWLWVLVNALSGPALGVSCYLWALKSSPAGVVLPIVAITPLVIIPFSAKFESERPKLRSLVGGLLAVAGAIALARCRAA